AWRRRIRGARSIGALGSIASSRLPAPAALPPPPGGASLGSHAVTPTTNAMSNAWRSWIAMFSHRREGDESCVVACKKNDAGGDQGAAPRARVHGPRARRGARAGAGGRARLGARRSLPDQTIRRCDERDQEARAGRGPQAASKGSGDLADASAS